MRRLTPQRFRTHLLPTPLPALAAAVLLTASCGLVGTDETAFESEPLLESGPVDASNPDGSTTAPADTVVSGPSSVPDDGVIASAQPLWPGGCGLEHAPRQPVNVVFDIAADDPDGGLNLRTAPVGGDIVRALPNGEVVYALDCEDLEADGVWWFVEDLTGGSGYVNARWLTDDLAGATARPRAASEAEERVEWLLASLAAEDWAGAIEALGSGADVAEIGQLPDSTTEIDVLIEHCSVRICDAPFEIVESTGTYDDRWFSPTVSVRFDYPTGGAIETFPVVLEERPGTSTDGLDDVEMTGVRGLPGRSVHGLVSGPVPVVDLVAEAETVSADPGLLAAAEQVRTALLSERAPRLPADLVAPEGVVISIDAHVSHEVTERVSVNRSDLTDRTDQPVLWGYADGTGFAVVETLDERLDHYRSDLALLDPDTVAVDRRVGVSTTIANLAQVFPDARVVEFHRAGRGDLVDFGWNSVRLAFEPRADGWTLVAITSDYWTT